MILNQINDRIGNLSGRIGIYYRDLSTGASCFAGNCDVFPSSGVAKIPVLLESCRQLHEGMLKREELYTLTAEDCASFQGRTREPSYGVLHLLHPGLILTLKDLLFLMTAVSDNVAFNILLKKTGMDRVNQTMKEWGFDHIRINRRLFDLEKMEQGIENYHSVQEMGEVFRRLFWGQLISRSVSQELLSLLQHHQRTNLLPYYFKEEQTIAHQTGFDEGKIHDVGIVYTEHPFVLCMSADGGDTRKAESVMRDVALICHTNSERLSQSSGFPDSCSKI